MSSTINTSAININYPIAGENNNSQGFRDNFSAIRNNLNTASTEITNLQNAVVVKTALPGTAVDNNMHDTLISNALTQGFRSTLYNLGSSLQGLVYIDVSNGDVQYGTITGDTTLSFGGWAVTGMQCNVELQLAIANSAATIYFPAQISSNNCYGVTTLESYADAEGTATVTIPYGVCQLDYRLSSNDCGDTITIEPYNRPRRSTQVRQRTPPPAGFQGDIAGDIAVDSTHVYVCTGSYDATEVPKTVTASYAGNLINCVSTTSLVLNKPIIFSGGSAVMGITPGTVYYVKSIPDGANITISSTGFEGTAGATFAVTAAPSVAAAAVNYATGSTIWKRASMADIYGSQTITGNLTVNGIANFPTVDNLKIGGPGALNGYYLQTDAGGNLSWNAGTVVAGTGTPGGANTQIQYNDGTGNFAATSGFTFDSGTSLMSAPGAITAAGNITSGNVLTATTLSVTANASVTGNLVVAANITATGTLTGGNIFTTGNVQITGNANVGALNGSTFGTHDGPIGLTTPASGAFTTVATSSTIIATGNVTGGNLITTGTVTATGNASAANVIATGFVITGVNNAVTALGTNQASAQLLNKSINVITSAAAGTGVVLPIAVAGQRVIVNNNAGNAISVYPNFSAAIGANAANAAYSLSISTSIEYYCSTGASGGLGGQWYILL